MSRDRLVQIAIEHGFIAMFDSDGNVVVEIPYVHMVTRENGIESFIANDLKNLKLALGY
jgi:hypothetical protein